MNKDITAAGIIGSYVTSLPAWEFEFVWSGNCFVKWSSIAMIHQFQMIFLGGRRISKKTIFSAIHPIHHTPTACYLLGGVLWQLWGILRKSLCGDFLSRIDIMVYFGVGQFSIDGRNFNLLFIPKEYPECGSQITIFKIRLDPQNWLPSCGIGLTFELLNYPLRLKSRVGGFGLVFSVHSVFGWIRGGKKNWGGPLGAFDFVIFRGKN